MIIVEGMDGTGKTHLVNRLTQELHVPVHERASRSKEGPVDGLFEWARDDVHTMLQQPFAVYDRHPLVSEYIYGPTTRMAMDDRFFGVGARQLKNVMAISTFVIFCDPGFSVLAGNLARDPKNQMPGVIENALTMHLQYRTMRHFWSGHSAVWDYTNPNPNAFRDLLDQCYGARRAFENRKAAANV